MGNTVPNKSTKLSYLYEAANDIIVKTMYTSVANAECNAQVYQNQTVILSDLTLSNCSLNINQYATVLCNLVAFFEQNFNNPTDTSGTNILSFVSKVVDDFASSTDPVIKNFTDVVNKRNKDRSVNLDAKTYIKNTILQNINISDFKSCSSDVFVVQDQKVIINASMCKDGKIEINQSAVIQNYASCIFGGILNAITVEPSFRDILRTYNNNISGAPDQVFGPIPDTCYTRTKVDSTEVVKEIDPNIKLIADGFGIFSIALIIAVLCIILIIVIKS